MEHETPLMGTDLIVDGLKRSFLFVATGFVLTFKKSVSLFVNADSSLDLTNAMKGFVINLKDATYIILRDIGLIARNMSLLQSQSMLATLGTVFSMTLLVLLAYQPISFLFNIIDLRRGDITPSIIRVLVSIAVVVALGIIMSYTSSAHIPTQESVPLLENMTLVHNTTVKVNASPSYIDLNY